MIMGNISLPLLLLWASLRRPEVPALGATLEMFPETPKTTPRVRVRSAEDRVGMTKL